MARQVAPHRMSLIDKGKFAREVCCEHCGFWTPARIADTSMPHRITKVDERCIALETKCQKCDKWTYLEIRSWPKGYDSCFEEQILLAEHGVDL